jgi:drug/metabolite transporter (DMT)-like permease
LSFILYAGLIGFLGYGLSLVLFVLSLHHLGMTRTGAYFSLAPFFGAGISLFLVHEMPGITFWLAALLTIGGVMIHLTERHEHLHIHEELEHNHKHVYDEHH